MGFMKSLLETPDSDRLADDILEIFGLDDALYPEQTIIDKAFHEVAGVCEEYFGNHIYQHVMSEDDRNFEYDNADVDSDKIKEIVAKSVNECRNQLSAYMYELIRDAVKQATNQVGPFDPDPEDENEAH